VARRSRLESLVDDTLSILAAVGIPLNDLTERRKVKMAKAFLSVAGMKPGMDWPEARSDNRLRSRDVIRWMNSFLGEDVSSGSYDDIRRKDLLLPVEAGIVLKSAGKAGAATNDGTRPYAISPETAELLHAYRTPQWPTALSKFLAGRESLAGQLRKIRQKALIPITIGSTLLEFGPGEHNELQKAVIENFLPRFGFGAEVLYVGDTEDKLLFCESQELRRLGFFELSHDKLPDVLAYSSDKKWLFLIEAVHSANPITELRKRTLEQLTEACSADIIYVSAFLSRIAFRKFAREIAWETEVWIAESPDHLIHFNGDKFLGPHVSGN
jgi:type II restriction enzyme